MSVFFSYKKTYPSTYTEVFQRKLQPNEMLKSLCKSVVVLYPKFV